MLWEVKARVIKGRREGEVCAWGGREGGNGRWQEGHTGGRSGRWQVAGWGGREGCYERDKAGGVAGKGARWKAMHRWGSGESFEWGKGKKFGGESFWGNKAAVAGSKKFCRWWWGGRRKQAVIKSKSAYAQVVWQAKDVCLTSCLQPRAYRGNLLRLSVKFLSVLSHPVCPVCLVPVLSLCHFARPVSNRPKSLQPSQPTFWGKEKGGRGREGGGSEGGEVNGKGIGRCTEGTDITTIRNLSAGGECYREKEYVQGTDASFHRKPAMPIECQMFCCRHVWYVMFWC